MRGKGERRPGRPAKVGPPAGSDDGKYIFVRNVSPGTYHRLRIAKARLGCDTWAEYLGESLKVIEGSLGD